MCSRWLCLFFCLTTLLQASWNAHFEEESRRVIAFLPELKDRGLEKEHETFYRLREVLLRDGSLKRQIKGSPPQQKLILLRPREGIVVKKRETDLILEPFAWELSLLFSYPSCLLPSFPLEISGKKVVVQKMEPFFFGKGEREMPPSSVIKKVSLENYWKAHLTAYLLGIGDLLGRNIGVTPDGKICFFDAEASFRYNHHPVRKEDHVQMGFLAESFDWPQYRQPLGRREVEILQRLALRVQGLEERWRRYEELRGISILDEEALHAFDLVRNFPFQEGVTFCDFMAAVYPRMSEGLDEASKIVGKIYKRQVDHGAALAFLHRHMRLLTLTSSQKREIDDWISRYVD